MESYEIEITSAKNVSRLDTRTSDFKEAYTQALMLAELTKNGINSHNTNKDIRYGLTENDDSLVIYRYTFTDGVDVAEEWFRYTLFLKKDISKLLDNIF